MRQRSRNRYHLHKMPNNTTLLAAAACITAIALVIRRRQKPQDDDDATRHVYRIVLTGGPCAGKTTAMARLSGFLQERGFRVYTVPEMATLLFTNGVAFSDLDKGALAMQQAVLKGQTTLEDGFRKVAAATRAPAVVLCDRGALDLSLIHISEPTRQAENSYAVFC